VRLTPENTNDETGSSSPALAVNAAGDRVLLWSTSVGARLELLRAVERVPASASWSAAADVAPVSGLDNAVGLDKAGDATAVYSDGVWVRTASRSRDGVWGSFVTLSSEPAGLTTYRNLAVNEAGMAVAGWSRFFGDFVEAGIRPGAVERWQPPTTLFRAASVESGIPLAAPAVAVDAAGNALSVWTWWDGSQRETQQVVASFRPAGSVTWEPAVVLGGPAVSYRAGVDGAIDVGFDQAGNATAVWSTGDAQLVAARRQFGGRWQASIALPLTRIAEDVDLAFDVDGSSVLVWQSAEDVESSVLAASSRTWGPITSLSTLHQFRGLAFTADARGNGVAVWSAGEWTKGAALWGAFRSGSSKHWSSPTEVRPASDSGYVEEPVIGIDAAGSATAAWTLFSRGFGIETADLRPNGPILEGIRIPRHAVVGKTTSFRVRAVPWAATLTGRPRWRFGDGRGATGAQVRHVFRRPGVYTVTIGATDATGATTATRRVTVRGRR
jgi:hypothetical protein